ncbi:MAG: DUF2125 domain-containing protein [Alphaproteobacteria bacterium]
MRRLLLTTSLLLPLATHAAPTDSDASALRATLQTWVSTWSNGLVGATGMPLTVRPDGEQFLLELPFGGRMPDIGVSISEGRVLARIRPGANGTWIIDDAQLPATTKFSTTAPAKGAKASAAPIESTTLTLGSQKMSGVFDPTLATESRLQADYGAYAMNITQPTGTQATTIDKVTARTLWTPVAAGRVSMTSDVEFTGYNQRITEKAGKGASGTPPVTISAQRMHINTLANDVDFTQLGGALRALFTLQNANPNGKLTAAQKTTLQGAVRALVTVVAGMDSKQEWHGINVRAGDMSFTLKQATMDFSMNAPDGKLSARMPIALEGFDTPLLPSDAVREFLPRMFVLSPRIAGVSKAVLLEALDRVLENTDEKPDMDSEIANLLSASPITIGLDTLSFDIGPLRIKGSGAVKVASVDDPKGAAELRATGLDALIKRANTIPDAKIAVPVLIFLKGIAETEGNELVWKLAFDDGDFTVNGTNLSDLQLPGK